MSTKSITKTAAIVAVISAAALALTACGNTATDQLSSTTGQPTAAASASTDSESGTSEEKESAIEETEASSEEAEEFKDGWTKVVSTEAYRNDFDAEDAVNMTKSNWANGGFFDCYWAPDNIVIEDGYAILSLTEGEEDSLAEYKKHAAGAEYTTSASYGFGKYTVSMKPECNKGVISSFFLYDNETADEIDIEFVGHKAAYEIELNYYAAGKAGKTYRYTLGFDPTEDFHEYGFEWTEEYIKWFVDGTVIYEVTPEIIPIPTHPSQIMLNLWNGLSDPNWTSWGGRFDETCIPVYTYYDYIEYEPITE